MKPNKKIQVLVEAMFRKTPVTYKKDPYGHPFTIQRINLDGEVDLYSPGFGEIIYYNIPYSEIKIYRK